MKSMQMVLSTMMLILLAWTSVIPAAGAITLTPEQQQKLAGMSDKQKADLARKAGVALPATSKKSAAEIAKPTVMKVRNVGTSNLEVQSKPKLEAVETQAVTGHAQVPVLEVKNQKDAEALEVRRAFASFARDAKPLKVNTNLKQFGYALFAGSPDTFAPATDVPVPAEYVLGPGDELNIHLYGREDEELVLVVDREGEIAFPSLGPVSVAGMGFAEAKAFIAQQVKEKLVGITADISMGKLRSIRIFALGDVARPGSYTVSGLSTISNALFVSGGIRKTGSLRNIQLKRNGQLMAVIDLYDFLLKGDTSEDERLMPGDVVFVPPIGKTAGVAGQVVRPAIYELKRERSVHDLITLAGGLLPTAYKDMSLIERIASSGGRSVVKISLSKRKPVTLLKNGDLLKVFSVTDYENNPVYLLGHVKRPGKYAWHKGMRLKELLPSADMLLPEAKLDYGVIERESGINRETSIVHFNVLDAINSKKSIRLQARDKVYVFKRAQLREMPMVQISGSVQKSGSYEVKKNMRLWDLVMAAGGLKRDALLTDIEIYRENPKNKDVTVQHYSLNKGPKLSNRDNPLLTDLDRVVIHSIYETRNREFVTIQGEVKNQGKFARAVNMHLSDLVFAAGGVTRDALIGEAQIYRTDPDTKDVSLISFDVGKALKGDMENNPLLQDLDRVMIHSIWEVKKRYKVSISGEVKRPGEFTLAAGMRLTDLLFAAGNVTERAYMEKAEITRYSVEGGKRRVSSHIQVNLAEALRGEGGADIQLEPYDVLMVRQISNWRDIEHVAVNGEVNFPGSYPVEEGEHLSSLLARAGGFSSKAYLAAAVFTRESIRKEQQKQLQELGKQMQADIERQAASIVDIKDPAILKRQQMDLDKAKAVLKQMNDAKATGRLVIRLADLEHFKGSEFDLRLRDGDKLTIPQQPDQVLVLGQVYNQAALLYRRDFSPDDYVDLAGGTKRFADTSRIYVIRANGEVDADQSAWRRKRVYPGDTIVVPQELEQFHLIDSLLDWSRVAANVGLTMAAFKAVGVL